MNVLQGLKRRAGTVPWRIAATLAQTRVIHAARQRRYDADRARHRARLPGLTPIVAEIVHGLEADGVFQTDLATLGLDGSAAMVADASALVARWADRLRAEARAGQEFLKVPPAEIAANPAIYQFGLHPVLLDLAEAYLGLPVAYDGVNLQYTVADGRAVSTRKWHRDREDRRMIKLAVYLSDVDADSGPFQLLPADGPVADADGRHDRFYLDDREDREIDGRILGVHPITCEGVAGTVVVADTARFFHRGKPATGGDRAALFYSYFARVPQRPYFCYRSGLSRHDIAALTTDLSQRQRDAAAWRQRLPLPWRLIPPSRV
ncbi:hypothetical protein [Sphingomonas echinoides]|uniref:hypothetical protein n=1 Tax=Sphingomonas echinoides TaxID=59803 RepID=UPI002413611D|nr:hypothetical protein [Sphingomonas echinoides]